MLAPRAATFLPAMISFKNIDGAFIQQSYFSQEVKAFLEIDDKSKNISLIGNDFLKVKEVVVGDTNQLNQRIFLLNNLK